MDRQTATTAPRHLPSQLPAWMQRPFLGLALIVTCGLMIGLTMLDFTQRASRPGGFLLNDYDAFFTAGRLYWEGTLAAAYDPRAMMAAQHRIAGGLNFTPWTYPPHFNLVVAVLALLPLVPGYALWVGSTLAGFVFALRRLAGGQWVFVWLALFPAALVGARNGQNGLLVGALLALFCLLLLRGSALAGLPLALLTIKPHLLPAIGLYLLLRREWRVIGVAAVATLALLALATLLFGLPIWSSFRGAVGDAAGFLERGAYPFYRMVSLYAALFRLGVSPAAALFAQLGFGLLCLGLVLMAWRAGWPPRHLLAAAIMASPMLSPYAYDYDLTILAVALGLLLPEIAAAASRVQALLLLLAGWWASGSGLLVNSLYRGSSTDPNLAHPAPSLGIFGVIGFCTLALWLARRPALKAAASDTAWENGARGRI